MLQIDNREPEKIFRIAEKQGIEYEKTTLLIGDMLHNEKGICIERKSMPDFIQSIRNGHLQEQLINMQNNYTRNYLIISGKFEDTHFDPHIKNFTVEHWLGSLASLSVRYNVKILQVSNDNQLVKLVKKIIDKTDDGKATATPMLRKTQTDDVYLTILTCVPGISRKKAQTIKDRFPTFSKFYVAAANRGLNTVKGIGPKLKQKIGETFYE